MIRFHVHEIMPIPTGCTDRTARRGAVVLALLFLTCGMSLHAQVTGSGGRPSPNRPSIRPVLIDVEFHGNDGVSSGELGARIDTRPTSNSVIKRVFEAYSNLFEANRRYVPRVYRTLFARTVDSLRGEIRYYNPTRAAADTTNILAAYHDHGYHKAQVRWDVRIDTTANTAVVRYLVVEGPRYNVDSLRFTGDITDVPQDVIDRMNALEVVELGKPYLKDNLTAEQERVQKLLRDNGFPFAAVLGETQVPAVISHHSPPADHPYDVIQVPVYTGGRYRFGTTVYLEDTSGIGKPVGRGLVLDQLEYKPGEWYSSEKIEQTRANLYALGVFDYVRIDTLAIRGDSLDLQVETQLRKQWDFQSALELGAEKRLQGWRLSTGLNGSISKTNLVGRAERLTVGGRVTWRPAEGGRFEWGVNAGLYIPSLLGIRRMSIGPFGSYDDIVEALWDASESDGIDGGVLRNRRIRGGFEGIYRFPRFTFIHSFPFRANFESNVYTGVGGFIANAARERIAEAIVSDELNCDFDGPDSAAQVTALRNMVERTMRETIYRLQVLQGGDASLVSDRDAAARENMDALRRTYIFGGAAVRDSRNDFFSPTKGEFWNLGAELGITGEFMGAFSKLDLDFRYHIPSGLRSSWAARLHVGGIVEFGRFPLTPNTSRFGAGGANSIRGWGVRDMLVTAPPVLASIDDPAVADCALPILQRIDEDSRRLQGGLMVLEMSGEYRGWLVDLPNTSTINRQLNQILVIGFVDAGNAYFRDYETDAALVNLGSIVENIALSIGGSLGYSTPFGPIRVGFGYPIYDPVFRDGPDRLAWNRPFTIGDFAWHLAIGHAF